MRELRLKKVMLLAQGHTPADWETGDSGVKRGTKQKTGGFGLE